MALLSEIPVGFEKLFLSDVSEDFEYKNERNEETGEYIQTEEYDTPFSGEGRILTVVVGATVIDRGKKTPVGFPVNVVIPEDGAEETLANLRNLPEHAPIKFDSLVVRVGVSGRGKIYQMFSAKGISFPKPASAPTRSAPPAPPATTPRAA